MHPAASRSRSRTPLILMSHTLSDVTDAMDNNTEVRSQLLRGNCKLRITQRQTSNGRSTNIVGQKNTHNSPPQKSLSHRLPRSSWSGLKHRKHRTRVFLLCAAEKQHQCPESRNTRERVDICAYRTTHVLVAIACSQHGAEYTEHAREQRRFECRLTQARQLSRRDSLGDICVSSRLKFGWRGLRSEAPISLLGFCVRSTSC